MFGLPISTQVKKQLPKKAIYVKFAWNTSQRESFDAEVARLDIVAELSSATLPALNAGVEVKAVYVLAIQLKRKEYDRTNLITLTKLIPQKMVFALQFEEHTQFAVHHTKLITSNWQSTEEATIPLSGLTLDSVWENIVKSIGQIEVEQGNTLAEQIADNDQRAKWLAQIATLERKMAKEKQPRRKRALFEEIKQLKQK